MPAQVAFYRDRLGLTVREPQGIDDFSQQYWVEFDTGQCSLALHGGGQKRFGEDAPRISFAVADIRQVRETLLSRGVTLGEPRSPAPNIWICAGRDPKGNVFSIRSQEARNAKRETP